MANVAILDIEEYNKLCSHVDIRLNQTTRITWEEQRELMQKFAYILRNAVCVELVGDTIRHG